MDTALGMELPLGTMLVSLFCALIFLMVFFAMNANRHVYPFFMVFFVGKSHQFDMAASFPCALSYFLFLVATGHEHSKWILIFFHVILTLHSLFPALALSISFRLFRPTLFRSILSALLFHLFRAVYSRDIDCYSLFTALSLFRIVWRSFPSRTFS